MLKEAIAGKFLSLEEGGFLYREALLAELVEAANEVRKKLHPGNTVTWMIDRNVNISNICNCSCLFCNFHRPAGHAEAYVTSMEEYAQKIREMLDMGGNQLLLQGGQHRMFGIRFYEDLFSGLKTRFPMVKLHALGPPEIVHVAKMEGLSYEETLKRLMAAGLDSLPGAGAEILVDRVRSFVSKNKCSTGEWLDVMRVAHRLGLTTSATMMFGHVETPGERLEHLIAIRQVQSEKPAGTTGFIAFIPWPFQDEGTILRKKFGIRNNVMPADYIRLIAISRLMLPNIPNIQASWLTVGKATAQFCLHAGANDFGSIMMEEHVVSAAGADHHFDAPGIQEAIREAGFVPAQRDQEYQMAK